MADATGTAVWRWDQQEPFGANPANEDPDGNSVAFDLPLRLPGQRYDQETGLHYNYFRDYDPSIGRYGESDPIGLRGGLNTYLYVAGNPLAYEDFLGLKITGTWINGTPKLSRGTLTNVRLDWIDPEWSWWGYIYVARLSGTLRGVVQASVRCTDDERCLEWEMHRDYPLSVDGSTLLGPNVYASAIGLLGGPKAAIGANAVLLAGKTGFALHGLYVKYGAIGGMIVSMLLDHGPDYACEFGFPNLTGVPIWP